MPRGVNRCVRGRVSFQSDSPSAIVLRLREGAPTFGSMALYDVILVGFPEGPKVGDSEAEALSTVFGIPSAIAQRMVTQVPAVVKLGVTEEVCRKYFNAFVYMGAKCDFVVSGEFADAEQRDLADSTAGGTLRLASTEVLSAAQPAPDSDSVVLPPDVPGAPGMPDVRGSEGSRTESAPHDAVGAPGDASGPETERRPEDLIQVSGDTWKSLPNQLHRSFIEDSAEATDLGENAGNRTFESGPSLALRSSSESGTSRAFNLALSPEMTPPEVSGWPAKGLELPGASEASEPPGPPDSVEAPAPKASIVNDDPVFGGTREARRAPVSPLNAQGWGPASDSAPADFLARGATIGEPIIADLRIPHETTGIPVGANSTGSGRGFDEAGPSVAEIRAAWQVGNDISLGADLDGNDDAPFLGDWDLLLNSELPDPGFSFRVAFNESQDPLSVDDAPSVDTAEGTQFESPRIARLTAHLDTQRRARELLAEDVVPTGKTPSMDAPETGDAPAADSNAPLFGVPLGSRAPSQTSSTMPLRPPSEGLSASSDPKFERPEPTEVPLAGMNFARLRKKRRGGS